MILQIGFIFFLKLLLFLIQCLDSSAISSSDGEKQIVYIFSEISLEVTESKHFGYSRQEVESRSSDRNEVNQEIHDGRDSSHTNINVIIIHHKQVCSIQSTCSSTPNTRDDNGGSLQHLSSRATHEVLYRFTDNLVKTLITRLHDIGQFRSNLFDRLLHGIDQFTRFNLLKQRLQLLAFHKLLQNIVDTIDNRLKFLHDCLTSLRFSYRSSSFGKVRSCLSSKIFTLINCSRSYSRSLLLNRIN